MVVFNTMFVRSCVGILGSGCGLLMYASPLVTMRRVMKKKSSEGYGGATYVVGMMNCLIYCWYASPMVSVGSENIVVLGINSIGLLLQCCFICIFILYASSKTRIRMCGMVGTAVAIAAVVAATSIIAMQNGDHKHRKILVGSVGTAATLLLFASPLSNIAIVVKTKNVDYMPWHFTLFTFVGSLLWIVYGALGKDLLFMAPNFVGVPLAGVQLIMYCIYRRRYQVHNKVDKNTWKDAVEATEVEAESVNLSGDAHLPCTTVDSV